MAERGHRSSGRVSSVARMRSGATEVVCALQGPEALYTETVRVSMSHTVRNNSKLFDELLQVLNRHHDEPGVIEAHEDLRSARANYVQGSIDHMVNCLVLTLHDL